MTQFGNGEGEATIYQLSGQCGIYQAPPHDDDKGFVLLQSPNNPVLIFSAGAEDGDYWYTYCLVDRDTNALSCGQTTSSPETNYGCGYDYDDGSVSFSAYPVWYLGGTPTGSDCRTFTMSVSVVAGSGP